MKRLAEFVLRHRKLVGVVWLVLFLAGVALSGKTTERLTLDFSLPGQPGDEAANEIIAPTATGGRSSRSSRHSPSRRRSTRGARPR